MDRSQRSAKGKGEGEGRKGKTAKDAMEIEEVDGEEGDGDSEEEEAGPDASQLPGLLRCSCSFHSISAFAPYYNHEVPNSNHLFLMKETLFSHVMISQELLTDTSMRRTTKHSSDTSKHTAI
jgi:hypothetical protein